MTQTYLSRLEHQAIAAEQQRHDDAEPAPLEDAIAWARHNTAMLGDMPELLNLQELGPGNCDECQPDHARLRDRGDEQPAFHTRFQLGQFHLCRACTLRRLHVAATIDTPRATAATFLEGSEPPPSLTRWAKEAGRHITDKAITMHLDEWGIHGAERDKLLKIAQHVRAAIAAKEAAPVGSCLEYEKVT